MQPLFYMKAEPWNSVRVCLQLPVEASERLKTLANEQASMLRDLGVLTVDIKEENSVISFNLDSDNTTAVSCSSATNQETPGSRTSVVNSFTSRDSHYCTSQKVSKQSQELNILASQRPNTCRKANGSKISTLSILADRDGCHSLDACTKLQPLSFHRTTSSETFGCNDKTVTSGIAESAHPVSETGLSTTKSLMRNNCVASSSHGVTLNGFRNSHLNHSQKFSGVHNVHDSRHQRSDSFQQSYKSAEVSLPNDPCNSPALKRSGCLPQSQVAVFPDSVTVAKNRKTKTTSRGGEYISCLPSDHRQSRKRRIDDSDDDNRLLSSKTNGHHHLTSYTEGIAGDCNALEVEGGTGVSFNSFSQHSSNVRRIINPYTGEMENVPDDDNLVMPHRAENAVANELPNHIPCYSTNVAVSGNPTLEGFRVSPNGRNASIDNDRLVDIFLQSVLARLESSSSSDNHQLLNWFNSVLDNETNSQFLMESVAKTEHPGNSLTTDAGTTTEPQLNRIIPCMTDDHSKRPLSNPTIGIVSNEGRMLGLVSQHQTSVSANSGISDVSSFQSGAKALQLHHSTEIYTESTPSKLNVRHLTQQGALGTTASQLGKLHQVQVVGCNSGISVSQMNTEQKFQKDIQDNLGNMVLQVGAMVSAEYQLHKVAQGVLSSTVSQLNAGQQMQQVRYQHQQVKDTVGLASHEFQQIADFLSGNATHEKSCNTLQNVSGTSRTTAASRLTSDDQLKQLSGSSEEAAFQMRVVCHERNGLSQKRASHQITSLALTEFQRMNARADANSSQKMSVRTGKEQASVSTITSMETISGHYRSADGNFLNGNFYHIPYQADASILGCGAHSASTKTTESLVPSSTHQSPIKKSRSHSQSKRTSLSVGKQHSQASSVNNFVHGRQVKPVTKSQPTVAQLLDEARAKQTVSATAPVIPPAVMSTTRASPLTAVPSFLHTTQAAGTWQKQMPNVALINLLPYSQPLCDFQCSTMEVLPLPRSSPSVPSLIAVPLRSLGLTEQESELQSGVTFIQGNPSHNHHHHLSAFVLEQCQGLVQPSAVELLSLADVKQEMPESRVSSDSLNVKIETTHSPVEHCDAKNTAMSAVTFTVKQEL